MAKIKTTLIKGKKGNVRINESDYDPDKHTLADGVEAPERGNACGADKGATGEGKGDPGKGADKGAQDVPEPEPENAGENEGLLVTRKGKKYIVVDAKGEAVERTGIDNNGYSTEQAAWDAIVSLS